MRRRARRAAGLLNERRHTSNALEYLKMVAPDYTGEPRYVPETAVVDGPLITANSTGGLHLGRLVLERLDLCSKETLEAWFEFFHTGDGKWFYALMESVAARAEVTLARPGRST
ncbi:type 1 glutamine amidotransferase family protein [Fodinicola feengrottensis]|uniref:hypothetical protein n=1 Tax=Fodinicola feengrottensis TaxID=435914 RepID=UPI0024421D15|nr:hypothetical protein [Fodinicola feengrottensis]